MNMWITIALGGHTDSQKFLKAMNTETAAKIWEINPSLKANRTEAHFSSSIA